MLMFRRVVGASMEPKLKNGQMIISSRLYRTLHPGNVVVVSHNGKEKVKRVERVNSEKVFVVGDNLAHSTDSRKFGWLPITQVVGKVWWPRGLAK